MAQPIATTIPEIVSAARAALDNTMADFLAEIVPGMTWDVLTETEWQDGEATVTIRFRRRPDA